MVMHTNVKAGLWSGFTKKITAKKFYQRPYFVLGICVGGGVEGASEKNEQKNFRIHFWYWKSVGAVSIKTKFTSSSLGSQFRSDNGEPLLCYKPYTELYKRFLNLLKQYYSAKIRKHSTDYS